MPTMLLYKCLHCAVSRDCLPVPACERGARARCREHALTQALSHPCSRGDFGVVLRDVTRWVIDAMRVNLSIAVVEMQEESGGFAGRDGVQWTAGEQGLVLGSFFYGCVLRSLFLLDCAPRRWCRSMNGLALRTGTFARRCLAGGWLRSLVENGCSELACLAPQC